MISLPHLITYLFLQLMIPCVYHLFPLDFVKRLKFRRTLETDFSKSADLQLADNPNI